MCKGPGSATGAFTQTGRPELSAGRRLDVLRLLVDRLARLVERVAHLDERGVRLLPGVAEPVGRGPGPDPDTVLRAPVEIAGDALQLLGVRREVLRHRVHLFEVATAKSTGHTSLSSHFSVSVGTEESAV